MPNPSGLKRSPSHILFLSSWIPLVCLQGANTANDVQVTGPVISCIEIHLPAISLLPLAPATTEGGEGSVTTCSLELRLLFASGEGFVGVSLTVLPLSISISWDRTWNLLVRTRLVFFAGRGQNSRIRQQLMSMWENDSTMDISSGNLRNSYDEGFRKSKYCLHVKGYEVNTARISDAIHFGCVPVIISNHYDLPFANVLDWSKFSIVVSHKDVPFLKEILLSISEKMYASFLANLYEVRKHFQWHGSPEGYDSFHMTAYQLWIRRGFHFLSLS
eukprot:Gb_02075 [translate_table: standard]